MTDHVVQLRYYRDGAENPVSWHDLEGGGTGAFLQPLVARRLGQFRHAVWEVRDTSPFPMDILAAAVLTDLQPGEIPLPLPDGTYRDASRPWTHQDVVNYLPCFAEAGGTRSAHKYATAPGLTTFANVGSGPHRGICDAEGVLYVVSGSALYRVAVDGTATSLGTIPGTGRVAMTYNQITNGHQLVIAADASGYVYNSYTSTLTQITDDGFAGFIDCDFLNQYIVGVEPQGKFWYHSELNDALSYNTLDQYPAETSPDPIVGIRASHNEVLVFGSRTIEPWVNDPENNAAATAFQLERGSVVERGCASARTVCRIDNAICFLGNDGIPYRLDGYTPRPIAPQALVSAWLACDWKRAFAFVYEDNGHVVYYLTFPDGGTWGYDVTASAMAGHAVWHRRQSFGLDRWRINTLVKSNGHWYGGDFQNGKLYRVEWGNVYEGCELMPRSFKTGVLHNNGLPVTVSAFRLTAATGAAASTPETDFPPSISGALPDATEGDVVSYDYTITPGYPGQVVTLTLNGQLPPGLTLSDSGHVGGTVAAGSVGTYIWSITPSSECAVGAPLLDSMTIAASPGLHDSCWDEVVSLLKFNEANGATTITDAKGLTWVLAGNAQVSTTHNAQGYSGSLHLDGTVGTSCTCTNAAFAFGTSDVTIECWAWIVSYAGNRFNPIFTNWDTAGTSGLKDISTDSAFENGKYYFRSLTGSDVGVTAVPTGTATHFAYSRAAGIGRFFVNGIQRGGDIPDNTSYTGHIVTWGGKADVIANGSNVYIAAARITKCGRYTANFTPPTTPFPETL